MNIFVAGGAGYVGSVLVPVLLERGHTVCVLDRFYFGDSISKHLKAYPDTLRVVRGDTRSFSADILKGVDCVIDLAGISNDPACELDPGLTTSVNVEGGKRLAQLAKDARVRRYIYSSSCSVYGHGQGLGLTETSSRAPVSAYARSKVELEDHLTTLGGKDGMEVVLLRLGTVFGLSPRMRFDLAVNVMTKAAYLDRRIVVQGGGRQWRPFVHVRDVADAFAHVAQADASVVSGQIFNVGSPACNVQILNLALRVRDAVGDAEVLTMSTDPDSRDYNVSFEKISETLGVAGKRTIESGVEEILGGLKDGSIDPDDIRWYTLRQYKFLAQAERALRDLAIDGRLLG